MNDKCWVVTINSHVFTSLGLPWLYHARRFPGIKLFVADAGLDFSQRKQLLDEKVVLLSSEFGSHFDMWTAIVNSKLSEGVILYSSVSDLFDPVSTFDQGSERMVFGKFPLNSEYHSVCNPLLSIATQARTANYIEDHVAKKFGALAAPIRVCGPAYLWKTMVGMTNFIRGSQSVYNQEPWEVLSANLFAASYPEYTLLQ